MIIGGGSSLLGRQSFGLSSSSPVNGAGSYGPATTSKANALTGDFDVVSSVSTTLSNGETLAVSRLQASGSAPQTLDGTASAGLPSRETRIADQAMFASFSQLATYFHQPVTAENTVLTGTAALDLKI